mmetsp:Transcript_8469/g.25385  ORF Transcript_8469/g.25385 Transcript_8469/m.25385 type:complete len:209 (-) Transcript_8469:196-822(-)
MMRLTARPTASPWLTTKIFSPGNRSAIISKAIAYRACASSAVSGNGGNLESAVVISDACLPNVASSALCKDLPPHIQSSALPTGGLSWAPTKSFGFRISQTAGSICQLENGSCSTVFKSCAVLIQRWKGDTTRRWKLYRVSSCAIASTAAKPSSQRGGSHGRSAVLRHSASTSSRRLPWRMTVRSWFRGSSAEDSTFSVWFDSAWDAD